MSAPRESTTFELHASNECRAEDHDYCPYPDVDPQWCPECEDWVPCPCECHDEDHP